MSPCDFLFSADLCVPDAAAAYAALERAIGPFGASRAQDFPSEGWSVVFGRTNRAMKVAPTLLEVIGPGGPGAGARVFESQAPRPWRTHATVVVTPDLDALAERVRRAGLRHWLQPPAEDVPFARLWMGVAGRDLADYRPEADGGFRFEFLPAGPPAVSARQYAGGADEAPAPGDFQRIVSRAFLVADLEASLRVLETAFGWPAGPVETTPTERRARLAVNVANGAALTLVQPTDPDAEAGRDLARWGPGPYTITLAVHGLSAKAEQLRERGVAFAAHDPGRLVPDVAGVMARFELVEAAAAS